MFPSPNEQDPSLSSYHWVWIIGMAFVFTRLAFRTLSNAKNRSGIGKSVTGCELDNWNVGRKFYAALTVKGADFNRSCESVPTRSSRLASKCTALGYPSQRAVALSARFLWICRNHASLPSIGTNEQGGSHLTMSFRVSPAGSSARKFNSNIRFTPLLHPRLSRWTRARSST